MDVESHSTRSESDDTLVCVFPTIYSHADVTGDKENISEKLELFLVHSSMKVWIKYYNIVNTYYFTNIY